MRPATNTLIVTGLSDDIKDDPLVLARILSAHSLNVELVHLPKFDRYLVVCATATLATYARDCLESELSSDVQITFSLQDNLLHMLGEHEWISEDKTGYLELPSEEGSRRFLILPPLSPQNEWNDYDKVEEGPHPKPVYSPEELSHLLWDRFGGFDSSTVRKFHQESDSESEDIDDETSGKIDISNQPQVLFENIDNGVPAIVVDSVRNQKDGSRALPKTSMPPM